MVGSNRRDKLRQKGFTLLELLISLGIFSVILAIVASVLGGNFTLFRTNLEERDNLYEERLAMEQIIGLLNAKRSEGYSLSLQENNKIVGQSVCETVYLVSEENDPTYIIYYDEVSELKTGDETIAQNITSFNIELLSGSEIRLNCASKDTDYSPQNKDFIKVSIQTGSESDGYRFQVILGTDKFNE